MIDHSCLIPKTREKHTRQYQTFYKSIRRTQKLLEIAHPEISDQKIKSDEFMEKLAVFRNPDELKEQEDPHHFVARPTNDGNVSLSLGPEAAKYILQVMDMEAEATELLGTHLNGISCVAAWSSFEGYIQTLLSYLFRKNKSLLSCDRSIKASEIVEHHRSILAYIITQEIDNVGRKNFNDLNSYLKSRIGLQIGNKFIQQMRDLYFIRNVVAHAGGYVRKDQETKIPKGLRLEDSYLQVTSEYVHSSLMTLVRAVTEFDRAVIKKYKVKELA